MMKLRQVTQHPQGIIIKSPLHLGIGRTFRRSDESLSAKDRDGVPGEPGNVHNFLNGMQRRTVLG